MKQLPARYNKLWQYMLDSNTPINENRIAGILQELFVDRVVEMKDMLKNNLKTMKVKDQFDLRGDGWLQGIIQKWEQTFMPDLMDEVMDIKRTPDIKDRAPKMRAFLHSAGTGTSPMNVLSVMEDDYRRGAEALHEPEPEQPVDPETIPENEPGFLRRTMRGAGSYAGGLARVAGSAAGAGLLMQRGMIGSLARGAAGVYGLHKAARKFTQGKAATTTSSRKSSVRSLFGAGKSAFKVKQNTDFTPREEQLEADGATSILKRIEENTAALLEKFTGKGQGDKKKGMFGGIMDMFTSLGSSLLSFLKGPAMMAAIAALGAAMAVAFGKKAAEYLCEKFSWLCPNADRTNSEWQNNLISGVESFANDANSALGITQRTERNKALSRAGQIPLDERSKVIHDKLAGMKFGLEGKKFTPEQIAGVMGSLKGENDTFDPARTNPKSGALGIAQWLGTRKDALNNFAAKNNRSPEDLETQLDFIQHEYNTDPYERKQIDKVLETTTAKEAAVAWTHNYERPFAGDKSMTPEKIAQEEAKRSKFAEEFYPEVLARQETKSVTITPKGLDWGYSDPETSTSKAFVPKNGVSMESALKSIEQQIIKESDPKTGNPTKRKQLEDAYMSIANNPNYSSVPAKPNAKAPKPKAPGLAAPAQQPAGQAGGTTLNVVAPQAPQPSIPKQRPGHRIQDESADKRNMEIRQFGLPR